MKIKKLHIKNFKSIADLEIIEPNPFTVFVGPNGSGKSNIFEALEFWNLGYKGYFIDLNSLFGGKKNMLHFNNFEQSANVSVEFANDNIIDSYAIVFPTDIGNQVLQNQFASNFEAFKKSPDYPQFISNFSRLFINSSKGNKLNFQDDKQLTFVTDNLEKVLKRILKDESKKEEILDWLRLFIPEFDDVFIESSELSRTDTLIVKEKYSAKYFTKDLISDGTYNILALLTAVFQSDEPQFLCIEEPENGLNPRVIKELVGFFRNACEEKGHYIWLNTHSQTLVSELTPDEIITVDKVKGETKIKQFKGEDFHGLSMDEAWLTNTLGGGLPW
ncbi:AAA family ATPase [Arcicella lustrica]|uniref:AAA family ATPase n=1 Tax=Arcicella lustrica TaxID=2984196 RepID=A0ABU5SN17_9BACT|nr:AAA family ATPase [Arcicella sp. DC25W]MEA5428705.1 AAA family ATPase [Arcicella sp. DC25W]